MDGLLGAGEGGKGYVGPLSQVIGGVAGGLAPSSYACVTEILSDLQNFNIITYADAS